MRRNKLLAGAALAAALSAGCRRAAPAPAAGPDVTLAAPAPSSATIASPLGAQTTGYTNEMQAQSLRDQAAELGISKLSRPGARGQDGADDGAPPATYDEGMARTKLLTAELKAQNRAINRGKDKTVAIPAEIPAVLLGPKSGGPIEPAPDADGPKGPETK